MSCPRWDRLVVHRYEGPEAREPEDWREALDHLDTCERCREEAFAADPSLIFRRMASSGIGSGTGPGVDAHEVETLRTGVDALRRARRLEGLARGPALHEDDDRSGRRPGHMIRTFWRAAAAALLAAVLLSVGGDVSLRRTGSPAASRASFEEDLAERLPSADQPRGDTVAAVDDFKRPHAGVYYLDDAELDVVLLVDPELDV